MPVTYSGMSTILAERNTAAPMVRVYWPGMPQIVAVRNMIATGMMLSGVWMRRRSGSRHTEAATAMADPMAIQPMVTSPTYLLARTNLHAPRDWLMEATAPLTAAIARAMNIIWHWVIRPMDACTSEPMRPPAHTSVMPMTN